MQYLPTMGGQTALNLCIEADEKGIWEDFDVQTNWSQILMQLRLQKIARTALVSLC